MIDFAVKTLIRALDESGIAYMVVGSYSSNYYGVPRSTKDLDVVIEVAGHSIRELIPRLPPEFQLDPQTTFETATFSIKNVVKIKGTPFVIELFHLSDDEHDHARFRRRVQIHLSDCSPFIPSPEDVVVTKLRWLLRINREKDRLDIFNILQAKQSVLDWPYIESWCDRHGTRDLLDEIRLSIADL